MRRFTDWMARRFAGAGSHRKRSRKARHGLRRSTGLFEVLETRSLLSAAVQSVGTATDDTLLHGDVSITAATAVPRNDVVIVEVAADPTAEAVSVTDDRGNVYAQDASVSHGNDVETWLFSAPVATGLAPGDHITVHFAGVPPKNKAVSALAASGLKHSNPLDAMQTGTGRSTAPDSGLTDETAHPQELLIGAIAARGGSTAAFTPGSGYALIGPANTNISGATTNVMIFPEYRSVSASGEYDADGTFGANLAWAAAIVAYVIDASPAAAQTSDQTNAEGDSVSLQITASDSDGDALHYAATGLPDGLSVNASTGLISGTIAGAAADHGPFHVDVAISDGANEVHDRFAWTVNNAAPLLVAGLVMTMTEGVSSGPVTVATFTDLGGPEPIGNYSATIDWGDGTTSTASIVAQAGGEFGVQGSHAYAEESTPDHTPGGLDHYIVKVTVYDDNLVSIVSATATSSATVSDPAPIATGGFTVSATEGQSSGLQTVAAFNDPGGAETVGHYAATIDWGDGTTTVGTIAASGSAFTVQGGHVYVNVQPGSSPYQITVTISHENATPNATAVSTANVAYPALNATGGFTISATEGQSSGLQTVATFTDPGGAEAIGHYAATIDWGDGTTAAGTIAATTGVFTVQGSHVYASVQPGSSPYQITVTIGHDNATSNATALSAASVAHATVNATGGFTISATQGQSSSLQTVATFTDPGNALPAGDYAATIAWGDGTTTAGTISATGGVFTVQGQHTYAVHEASPIKVTVSKNGGPNAVAESNVKLADSQYVGTGVTVSGFEFSPLTNVAVATFTHAGGIEPPANFKATIDWGDGATSLGAVSLASGVYTVTGSHTYTDEKTYPVAISIQDVGPGGDAATTVNTTATMLEELLPDGTRGTPNQRFISEVYRDLLDRHVEQEGLAYWDSLLSAGQSREQVMLQIVQAPEFVRRKVQKIYQQYLHRDADQGALAHFSGLLKSGTTIEQIAASLTASDEFFASQGGGTNDGFLNAVYEDALGRPIDAANLSRWKSTLSGGASRGQVVDQILSTGEYHQVVVKRDYEQLLDREVEPAGLQHWTALLDSGATDQQIIAGICSSMPEYYNKTAQ